MSTSPPTTSWVNVASNWNSAYTPVEVAAIKAFVFNGGGLLVMGDNPGTPNSNLQPVSQAFGATLAVSATAPLDLYITNFASHPLFSGLASIYYRASGELAAVGPSSLIAWDPSNKGAVAVASYGGGKVLVLGEATNWDNTYLGYANNQLYALPHLPNGASWLFHVKEGRERA